jgi:hypothetical protein
MSKEDRLVEKLFLWKKSTDPVDDAKDDTMIKTDKTILFQLLFGLYVANSTYGINPTNMDEFKVEELSSKTEMIFALEAGGDYDVFKLETQHRVVLQYKSFGVATNLETGKIADIFKTLLKSDFAGKLLLDDLSDPKQDYGTGIEWGVNLALFHPYFKEFYAGETTAKPQNALIFENGHQPIWLKISDKDARKAAQEKIYAEGKTYTLDQFKDVIKELLEWWDTTTSTAFDDTEEDLYNQSVEKLTEIYGDFRDIYTENEVKGMGKLTYFSDYTTTIFVTTYKDNILVPKAKFSPKPTTGATGYSEIGPRTRGYISVFLSIISLITGKKYYQNMTSVDAALASSNNFKETAFPNIQVVFDSFNKHFRGAEVAIKALQTEYDALKSTYDRYNTIIQKFRADKHTLDETKLKDAGGLINSLDITNYSAKESAAKTALEEAKKEEGVWKAEAEASKKESTVYEGLKKESDDLIAKYNNALAEYQTYGTYSGVALPKINLGILETTNDFNNDVIGIRSQIELAKNTELKQLLDKLQKKKGANDFQSKVNAIKLVYSQIETLKTEAFAETTNYRNIWGKVNVAQVGLDDLTKSIKSIKDEAQIIATQTGLDMTEIKNYFTQIDTWRAEILKYASYVQRQVDGDALQKAYDALRKDHPDIQTEINNFKNNEAADQTTLTEEKNRIETLINNQKTKDQDDKKQAEKDKINAEAKEIDKIVPVLSFANPSKQAQTNLVNVLRSDKTEAKILLKDTSAEFQTLIDANDDISKSRVAAGAVALGLPNNNPNKRKMLAYAQMF